MVFPTAPAGSRAGLYIPCRQYDFCQHRLSGYQFIPHPRQLDESGYNHQFRQNDCSRRHLDTLFYVFKEGGEHFYQMTMVSHVFTGP